MRTVIKCPNISGMLFPRGMLLKITALMPCDGICLHPVPRSGTAFFFHLVNEVLRTFTLQLWNTYSFFVLYANLDQWKPEEDRILSSTIWIDVVICLECIGKRNYRCYENYDVNAATRPIQTFVDRLPTGTCVVHEEDSGRA